MKKALCCLLGLILVMGLSGCGQSEKDAKVGVSFAMGQATRWAKEKVYMEERAEEIGLNLEARLTPTGSEKTQVEECKELIDGGINVLIINTRDADAAKEILEYAKSKEVKVISYARVIPEEKVDLHIGYDSVRIGQTMGQFLSEFVYEGDYIILKGDPGDENAIQLYNGAMRYIDKIKKDINIVLEADVTGWDSAVAKDLVYKAVKENGNKIDAILAPNDKLAGGCAEALKELGVTAPVVITGMDAEIEAVKRIISGEQTMTVYLDLKELANLAVDQAKNMATGAEVEVNTEYDNRSGDPIDANLIVGKVVTKENLDKILIDSGYFSHEEVYGK